MKFGLTFGPALGAFWLLLAVSVAMCHLQQQHQQQPLATKEVEQPLSEAPHQAAPSHRYPARRTTYVRREPRPAPSATGITAAALSAADVHAHCEYKDMLASLYDRVALLASLDEEQRKLLESMDKKITQFEESNLAHLDSLGVQQMDFLKRLDSMEHIERLTRRELEELKDAEIKRSARAISNRTDASSKLDALAILLTSTRAAIDVVHSQLETNLTSLQQQQNYILRRLNKLSKNRQQQSGFPTAYTPANLPQHLITSCAQQEPTVNGVLRLQLTATSEPFYVQCDEQHFGGGWTIIQNRFTGDIGFNRNWAEYKAGFGNLASEFFIGLEKLHALTTSAVHELLIVMQDWMGEQRHARYDTFAIGSEEEAYVMNLLGAYEGDAGDSLTYHAGSKFSTFDNDNDGCADCNCAQGHSGAWWYNWCEQSNLNGLYIKTNPDKAPIYQGMYWHSFHGVNYSLQSVRMMIRPVDADLDGRRRR